MFAQQTLLFLPLSSEQQLPNGVFVLGAFLNGLHTNPVCFPRGSPNKPEEVWLLSLRGQS